MMLRSRGRADYEHGDLRPDHGGRGPRDHLGAGQGEGLEAAEYPSYRVKGFVDEVGLSSMGLGRRSGGPSVDGSE